jgi:ABC-type multidrug transport system fused ATPase/permease subunit
MLYERLGVVFVAPIGVTIVCSIGLGILVNFTGDSQRTWMSGIQKRVSLTATVITSIKSLKISGLSTTVGDYVQQLRVDELAAGARFRKIFIIAAVFAFMSQLISPPLTFAFTQRAMDASKMFTSLSFLTLLTSPLSQVFQSIPELVSGLACLGRIQAYLESEPHHDFRQVLATRKNSEKSFPDNESFPEPNSDSTNYFVTKNASFGWKAGKFVLQNVSTQISKSSLTMVIGPVGSGKSTFCKALLREVPFSDGSIVTSSQFQHIGFCEQTAFLSNGTIRDNIIGFSPFNDVRYNEVIEATSLGFDFEILPQRDHTNIGSDGIALSGGQKQRVSLARALYLQSELLILDDVFSGLDADTEEHVFRHVFGADGLLRRQDSTVVLCTHSIRHLPFADYIIALEDGIVTEQGTFGHVSTSQGYIQRLGLKGNLNREPCEKPAHKNGATLQSQPTRVVKTTVSSGTTNLSADAIALRQVGDTTVYRHYFKSMGWFVAACSLFFAALWGFFTNYPSICEFLSRTWSTAKLISQIHRAHILGRCHFLGPIPTSLRLLRGYLCAASNVRYDSTATTGNYAFYCFCQEGRCCSTSGRATNLDASTTFILHEDRHWRRNQLVFTRFEFDRYGATRCDVEYSVLCQFPAFWSSFIFWLSNSNL